MSEACKCDSCGKEVDTLVPIRVLCETNGGMEMQLRHYCPECFMEMMDDWEPPKVDEKEWVVLQYNYENCEVVLGKIFENLEQAKKYFSEMCDFLDKFKEFKSEMLLIKGVIVEKYRNEEK